ncbi:hypothetical protein [Burkholderia glumae]|uniref:hypothetical protein n=1 Tax=Burkholderia glumae TaxID=337 RepID=UPI0021513294|nr:hypothetical protein [Burkholderia glumae]
MFGTANITVRPLKLALLVDPNNAAQVREAIRMACSLWGGMFFPIIPMHKRMPASWREGGLRPPSAKNVALGYIDAFDPDVLVQFADELPSYISDARLRVVKPQEIWRQNNPAEFLRPSLGISALEILNDIYNECFKYKAKYPRKITLPESPRKLSLFWSAAFGEYPSNITSAIDEHYTEPLEIEHTKATPESFSDLISLDNLFPTRISAWRVERRGGLLPGRQACIYFMDAANIEDIVDYWNLRATGRTVIALPKQFSKIDSFNIAIHDFIVRERRPWRHAPEHFDHATFICSRHTTMEELQTYALSLNFGDGSTADKSNPYFSLQHWYPRIWDEWARGKDGGVADIYTNGDKEIEISSASDLEMRLKPLLPEFTKRNWIFSDGFCANEFNLRLYGMDEHLAEVYPKVRGVHLARAISGIVGSSGDWRIGRHGLVKIVRNSFAESRTVPTSDKIFFAWLADRGWKAELSPPGILVQQIYKRLDGHPALFANKQLLSLIEHMNGGAVSKNGTPSKDYHITSEREMAVGEVKRRLSEQYGKSTLYDAVLERGVFKLGLKTKCPNCQRNTWFSLPTIREVLECPKCLNSFSAIGNIDQASSNWFYRTTGPFSVPNYADGAFTVLLTLDALGNRVVGNLRTTAVPSFTAKSSNKRDLEADFAMFWKEMSFGEEVEGLLFGECKTYGPFEAKDFDRMRYLAKMFPGAVLVFSTLRETLSRKEITALTRLAKSGRKYWKPERPINPILILTGTELLSEMRPPYCWSEIDQKRFTHIVDLIALCDATQQRYLNLPSWHEDWRKAWERRRERRAARHVAKTDK